MHLSSWATGSSGASLPAESRSLVASRRLLRKGFLFLLGGLTLTFLFVWSRIQVIRVGYEVSRLKSANNELEREVGQLRLTAAKKKTLGRLNEHAAHAGMALPAAAQIIYLY